MAKRIRMAVAYDGTNYHGWQLQDNGNTIEAELNRAIGELTGEETFVIGASRTDAGVHALGNVAVFDTETRIPPEKISRALNVRLPEDIRVLRSEEVPADWHPRRQDCRKTYEYRLVETADHQILPPTMRLYAHPIPCVLNLSAMREAGRRLEGTHDFAAFCAAGSQAQSTVRTLYSVEILEGGEGHLDACSPRMSPPDEAALPVWEPTADAGAAWPLRTVSIRVTGNGFLYNMVRILAGTLVDAGRGRKAPGDIPQILESRDRRRAGPTLPAKGLFLIGYEYSEKPEGSRLKNLEKI